MRSEKEILQAIKALQTKSPDGEPEVYIENIRSFIVALQWVLEGGNLTSQSSRPLNSCAHKTTFPSKVGGTICEDCGEYI